MQGKKFEGILPALVTPLKEDNVTVNTATARQLVELFLEQGANGFYILGGTGEGLVMDKKQRQIMAETVVDQVKGRKPIINHIAAVNINDACDLARHAEQIGCDAIAAIPPVFFKYRDNDIYNYYKRLADSVNIPVVIYYHPYAQGAMSAKLISRIFTIDNVTGVKWSSNDFFELMKLKDMTKGEMNIICGPDELLVAGLAAGVDAGIGSTYNVMLPEYVKLYNLFREGKTAEALQMQIKINRVLSVMIGYGGVIPSAKAALTLMGYDVGYATFPFEAYQGERMEQFSQDMKAAGWPFNK